MTTTTRPPCAPSVTFTESPGLLTADVLGPPPCDAMMPVTFTVSSGGPPTSGHGEGSYSAALPVCGPWSAAVKLDKRVIGETSGDAGPCETTTIPTTTLPPTTTPTTVAATTTLAPHPTTTAVTTTAWVPPPGAQLPHTGAVTGPVLLGGTGVLVVGAIMVAMSKWFAR